MTHHFKYDLAIDPGSVGTGVAVFRNGRIMEIATIWPKGKDRIKKLLSLRDQYRGLLIKLGDSGAIARIAVEEWHKHISKEKTYGIMKCAEARGVIIAVSLDYAGVVSYISKGTKPKIEAVMIAKSRGCEGSEHAIDALHLGILAGFETYY